VFRRNAGALFFSGIAYYAAYWFKDLPGANLNRVMFFITLARRVKHMDVFHKSDFQGDLKNNEVSVPPRMRWPFFMPMDGRYLKNAGAIFKECFGGTPGLCSLAA